MSNKFQSSWLSGFLAGGAIAATVAILSAPRAGDETREMIREKTVETRENALQALNQGRNRLEAMKTEAQKRIRRLKAVKDEAVLEQKELLEESARKARSVLADEPA